MPTRIKLGAARQGGLLPKPALAATAPLPQCAAQSRYPRRQRDAIFLGLLLASDPFSELMIVQPDREARRPSRSEMDHERVVIGRTLLAALAFDLANEWHAGDTRMQPPHHLPASFAVL